MDASRRKVFVSYSYDSPEHERAVRELVRDMERAGIECLYDQNGEHGMRWAQWMDQQIDDADHVLVICSRMYRDRLRQMAPSGVQFEGGLIIQRLYSGGGINHKFIPVLLKAEDREYIPSAFAGYNYFDLSRPGRREELFRRVGSTRQRGGWRPEVDVAKGVVLYPDGQEAPFTAPCGSGQALIGREKLFEDLRAPLIKDIVGRERVALSGCAGVGKTALATALAHDPDVLEHYSDGVLWASLGRTMSREMALAQWASSLGVVSGREEGPDTEAMKRALASRRMLLVVDNAYDKADVDIFYELLGPESGSALIVTARMSEQELSPRDGGSLTVCQVPPLDDEAAKLLFQRICPDPGGGTDGLIKCVIKHAGGLPLALELIGSFMRAERGNGRCPFAGATNLFPHKDEEPAASTSSASGNSEACAAAATSESADLPEPLAQCIRLCYDAVGAAGRECLLRLTVFPGRPNTFSHAAARRVAAPPKDHLAPTEVLEELLEYGLMEHAGPGRYSIHSTIREYARERDGGTSDAARRAIPRMIRYYGNFAREHATCYRVLRPEQRNLLQMLEEAAKRKAHRPLLKSLAALSGFFETQGLYWLPLVRDHLSKLEESANKQASAARREEQKVEIAIERARRDEKLGRYTEAQSRLKPHENAPYVNGRRGCDLLYTLGVVEFNLCRYDDARQHLNRAYDEASKLHDRERMCRILERICLIAMYTGDGEGARKSAADARELVRGRTARSPLAKALLRLARGRIALIGERYESAARYACRGLDHSKAEAVGPEVEAALLQVQARAVLADQSDHGRCREAIYLMRRAIDLAHRIGHRWYHSYLQYELGKIHLREGDFERAAAAFGDAIMVARDLRARDLEAFGLLGMARLAAKRFMPVLASRQAEESLKLFEEIHHFKASEVRQLLAEMQVAVAQHYAKQEEPKLAIEWFDKALKTADVKDAAKQMNGNKLGELQTVARAGKDAATAQRRQREREQQVETATKPRRRDRHHGNGVAATRRNDGSECPGCCPK